MKLKRPLPSSRSLDQIKNHYFVEKSIAKRLKTASLEQRKLIYSTMYDELFSKVPDHPRLTRRDSRHLTDIANRDKFSIVDRFLAKSLVFLEFAPGDCKFVLEVAKQVKYAYGVDISDQRNPKDNDPENFDLVVYDGYKLELIESNSIDLVFSDQLIEHFHPDDTKLHFQLVRRILKVDGRYVFRTPHFLAGPHDISKYFSDEPECFHLKEWTYTEIRKMIIELGYSDFHARLQGKGFDLRIPYIFFAVCEYFLGLVPKRYARIVAEYLIPSVYGIAIK